MSYVSAARFNQILNGFQVYTSFLLGRRSDIYYSESNWDSDLDNSEPLRKCPKFDDNDKSTCQLQIDERSVDTITLKRQREDQEDHEQEVVVKRSSTSSPKVERSEEVLRHCNQNLGERVTDQVVPTGVVTVASCSVSRLHREQVFLLLRNQKEEEQNNQETVALDEVGCDMGQSHESENVFSQSEHQFSNSVVEFSLDGNYQCVGMKRKLSSPSSSPPLSPSSALQYQHQQVVPRNISIYYFKHSDTEQELQQKSNSGGSASSGGGGATAFIDASSSSPAGVRHLHSVRSPQQIRRANRTHCEKSAITTTTTRQLANCTSCNCNPSGGGLSLRRTHRHQNFCQKSRLFLDMDQEFEDDITSVKSYDELSFGSFDLDLDEDLEEGEVLEENSSSEQVHQNSFVGELSEQEHCSMMDLEGNLCTYSSSTTTEQREMSNCASNNNINGNHNYDDSGNRIKSNSTSSSIDGGATVNSNSSSSNKPVSRLNEIEELVQKAELLVRQTTRSRGVDCVDLPIQVGSSEDDEDDETLMLPQQQQQKHCGDRHYHQHHHHYHKHQDVMMITPQSSTSNGRCSCSCGCGEIVDHASANGNNSNGQHELLHSLHTSLRKCSVSSGVSSSSISDHHHHHKSSACKVSLKSLKSSHHSLISLSSRTSNSNSNVMSSSISSLPKGGGVGVLLDNLGGADQSATNTTPGGGVDRACSNINNATIQASSSTSTTTTANAAAGSKNVIVGKSSKKSTRVRQWIRAHNSEIVVNQKNTSSCDASAESASDSEYSSSSDSEHPISSDDPTTVSASTFLQQTHAALLESSVRNLSTCSSSNNISGSAYCIGAVAASLSPSSVKSVRSPLQASSSDAGNQTITPFSQLQTGAVTLRSKKRLSYGKQRPKSFTDTLEATTSTSNGAIPQGSPSNRGSWLRTSPSCFVSDSAINLLGNKSGSCSEGNTSSSGGDCACSPSNSNTESPSHSKKKSGSRFKRRSQKGKKNKVDNSVPPPSPVKVEDKELRSPSFTESAAAPLNVVSVSAEAEEKSPSPSDGASAADQSSVTTSSPKPNFLISGPISRLQPFVPTNNSDNGSSMNTEDLTGLNDQADWDSYQEKYLSEPYSEEPYDPDGTLKLLAFGEDYGQYLDRADSESSSMLSGFEPAESRKRRPLAAANRGEMADSDSDREELNYLLRQSNSQLRFIDMVFRGLLTKGDNNGETPAKYAEMEATCDENISSLTLVLSNVEESENLPFEIDVKSIQDVLEKWHILREKIRQAANIHHIKEEMGDLKMDFSNVHSLFCNCKQFDITDMDSLKEKIRSIEDVLHELPSRKLQLQQLNDASLKTKVFLEDETTVGIIKQQLNELYVLYEDNLQLGTFLLEKMRYLQDAWEQFEKEKQEFEKSVSVSNMRTKLRKEFSSSASTDSGHGTDFSHDSSISDSDMEFQERHKKLVALKERAKKVKAFLPPGSPVLDILDQSVEEAEKGLSSLKQTASTSTEVIDLKSLYPRKKPFIYNRRSTQKSSKTKLLSPPPRRVNRKWTVVRRMVMFNMALMGIFLAAAYFLHPKCCEFTNTFCFSLVPHLTHESLPPI